MDCKAWCLCVWMLVATSGQAVHGLSKTCRGLGPEEFIHGGNIDQFVGCTVVDGDLRIMEGTFEGDRYQSIAAIEPAELYVLESVEQITGHLQVQGGDASLSNLDFLNNLRVINGRSTSYIGAALQIYGTSLTSLELSSLEEITDGTVIIGHNSDLCYADSINWDKLFRTSDQRTSMRFNAIPQACAASNEICDEECTSDGCWGSGNKNCLECKNRDYDGQCLPDCYRAWALYQTGDGSCERCHPECNTCYGPGADQCVECKNFQLRDDAGDTCVQTCPSLHYVDYENNCVRCDAQCKNGCSGPRNDECFECAARDHDGRCVEHCPPGKYVDSNHQCLSCNEQCAGGCTGIGAEECIACSHVKDDGTCLETCPYGKYADYNRECQYCHRQCAGGCTGPGDSGCAHCDNVQLGDACVESCPLGTYSDDSSVCEACDAECEGGCTGPGRDACLACKTLTDDGKCVESCPHGKYPDASGFCQACHPQCDSACSGPDAHDCYTCRNVKDDGHCAPECPDYKFADYNSDCQQCDVECLHGCYGAGPSQCIACRNYRDASRCVSRCASNRCADSSNDCGPCEDPMPTFEELVQEVRHMAAQTQEMKLYGTKRHAGVYFSAYSRPERSDYIAGDFVRFDGVITNVGGGFDPSSGAFVCPSNGVYLFAVSVDNYMRGSLIPSIYKGRELVASAGAYNSASQTVIIECDQDEEVTVRSSQGGTVFNMHGWKTSIFTGYLLNTGHY